MNNLIERANAILSYPHVGEDTKAVIRQLLAALNATAGVDAEQRKRHEDRMNARSEIERLQNITGWR